MIKHYLIIACALAISSALHSAQCKEQAAAKTDAVVLYQQPQPRLPFSQDEYSCFLVTQAATKQMFSILLKNNCFAQDLRPIYQLGPQATQQGLYLTAPMGIPQTLITPWGEWRIIGYAGSMGSNVVNNLLQAHSDCKQALGLTQSAPLEPHAITKFKGKPMPTPTLATEVLSPTQLSQQQLKWQEMLRFKKWQLEQQRIAAEQAKMFAAEKKPAVASKL